MEASELFELCRELATEEPTEATPRRMHELLVLTCAEGTRTAGQGFGNVFSQVDFLCKRHGISMADRVAIQTMRRHSNSHEVPQKAALMADLHALCLLISAVFGVAVPAGIAAPQPPPTAGETHHTDYRCLRCIVMRVDDELIYADTEEGSVVVEKRYEENATLWVACDVNLREGMQLNLLDVSLHEGRLRPRLVVVEPDFLVDISLIARCFNGYGHHALSYTAERLKPRTSTQAMLLGNLAGTILDDVINQGAAYRFDTSLDRSLRQQALQVSACEGFNRETFVSDAVVQAENIQEASHSLFGQQGFEREKALLEPSFVCERLGLQGRVDLMTSDLHLLVEQKSGRNMQIERSLPNAQHKEDHYVQLLLYYGILRYNFGRSADQVDIRLLYSRYPARQGLLYVNFYQALFREAIRLRNQIVATELFIAREGFGRIAPYLTNEVVYKDAPKDSFFYRFIEPELRTLHAQLSALSPLERAYYERMLTFVYREQLCQKLGVQEGQGGATSDLWQMPLAEKRETGNIFTDLRILSRACSDAEGGFDLLTLQVPSQGADFLPNFRRGDMVYLYAYDGEPDVRRAILYKGTLQEIATTQVVVRLTNGQQNVHAFDHPTWAIEHAGSDQTTTSNIKSMQLFATAPAEKRQLLLGQRAPRRDTAARLPHSFHEHYDEVLLKAHQALDYFLLVGPPGTGKTSMALRFLVELSQGKSMLIAAYTNRAVDEICAMLVEAGQPFLRIGNESSCDPRFRPYLLDAQPSAAASPLEQHHIIVGTTSMLQARSYLFRLKHFELMIVDEASQILEPQLVGLLVQADRFILIGDHKQLPAVVQQRQADTLVSQPLLSEAGITDCRMSLFERLLRWERRQRRSDFVGILRRQGRMHPDVAAFPNRMFYAGEQLVPVPLKHQVDTSLHYDLPSLDATDDALKQHRVLFFDVQKQQRDASDKVNADEARLVSDLLRRIHRFYGERFDPDKTVGVIVPYRNQIAMLRREIERLGISDLLRVSIDTVERYQGSQRDVIIYSFTVSRHYQLDFLTSNTFTDDDGTMIDRKLNVALTRARCQMLMTGNARLLSTHPVFRELVEAYTYHPSGSTP